MWDKEWMELFWLFNLVIFFVFGWWCDFLDNEVINILIKIYFLLISVFDVNDIVCVFKRWLNWVVFKWI